MILPYPNTPSSTAPCSNFRYIAVYADACAQADFLPPIVIRVACWMSTFQVRYGLDARKMPMFAEHSYLPSLWKAYDDYVLRQTAEELKCLVKVSKAPNMYRCAADRCGIQAMSRGALRKCGGKCREEVKPYYCSGECQRKVSPAHVWHIHFLTLYKHWFIHRYACRRSARYASPIVEDDGVRDWIDVENYEPHYDDDALAEDMLHASKQGVEIFIDIPDISPCRKGEVMRVRTKTLSAAFLRSYRTKWKLPEQARLRWDQLGKTAD